jgi:hypothetical protein
MGLEKLFFEGDLSTDELAMERADTIDAYIEACGWNWDQVLEEMGREENSEIPTQVCN